MFKECGRRMDGRMDGQTADDERTTEAYLSCKLTNEPSAQVSELKKKIQNNTPVESIISTYKIQNSEHLYGLC